MVLDASVAAAWFLADEASKQAEEALTALSSDGALAPAIWPFEIANVLTIAARRNRLSREKHAEALTTLGRLRVFVEATAAPLIYGPVTRGAERHGLTIYDAAYLELAQRERLPLATLDRRLTAAAREAGVQLFWDS